MGKGKKWEQKYQQFWLGSRLSRRPPKNLFGFPLKIREGRELKDKTLSGGQESLGKAKEEESRAANEPEIGQRSTFQSKNKNGIAELA